MNEKNISDINSGNIAAAKPVPRKGKDVREAFGERFEDPYEWMRNKESKELKDYVDAQNAYYRSKVTHLKNLAVSIYDDFLSEIDQTDNSVPVRNHDYWYFAREKEGQQYGVYCRVPIRNKNDWTAPKVSADETLPGEEIIFDTNLEAQGHDFFSVGGLDLSRNGRYMLYTADTRGDERYDIRVRDLKTGKNLSDEINGVFTGCITPDGQWIFYIVPDKSWRPYKIMRHKIGTSAEKDALVYEEKDERFWAGVAISSDETKAIIASTSKTTSEILYLPLDDPEGEFKPFAKREEGVEYDVGFAYLENAVSENSAASGKSAIPGENAYSSEKTEEKSDSKSRDIPVAVVMHNRFNPNFQVDIIDLREQQPPFVLGEGKCIAEGSPLGCESDETSGPQDVNKPFYSDINPKIVNGEPGLCIESLVIYKNFVTMSWRANGLPHIAAMPKEQAVKDYLNDAPWSFKEILPPPASDIPDSSSEAQEKKIYNISFGAHTSYEVPRSRYLASSYTRPSELHDFDPKTGEDALLKRAKCRNRDLSNYAERLIWVRVADGCLVPVSLTWRKDKVSAMKTLANVNQPTGRSVQIPFGVTDLVIDAPSDRGLAHSRKLREDSSVRIEDEVPLFITGYGAYESCSNPYFSPWAIVRMDRGIVNAYVHVRGGGEMGRAWYEQGRRQNKKNTFFDFIDVTAALHSVGWGSPLRTVADGGSAGGLLMGAIMNYAPWLYNGVDASVPFVDVVTTLRDPELPLTVTEWDEWGNPLEDEQAYRYIRSYSPYDNVLNAQQRREKYGTAHYPKLLAVTSMNDTRVLYVEPLKWVSRLQEDEVGCEAIIRIDDEQGHGGASGRYDVWKDVAADIAWCCDAMHVTEKCRESSEQADK